MKREYIYLGFFIVAVATAFLAWHEYREHAK